MFTRIIVLSAVLAATWLPVPARAQDAEPFLGRWALTLPDGRAGWLGVRQERNYLDASILWGGGSVVPVASVYVDGDRLIVTRIDEVERRDDAGAVVRTQRFTETIVAELGKGDTLALEQVQPRRNGLGVRRAAFSGVRIPPLPDPPNLDRVNFGEPIALFNGQNLDGWELVNPKSRNGWTAENGALVNKADEEQGFRYGNLRTVDEFEDFNLTLEVQVPEGGNSGVYLRGIYEVQVLDSYGQDLDSHNMGAVYSRIAPTVSAERPAGEWQRLDMTLVDRHITVKLNGTTIIDNQPLRGCTGGALWSDEFRPGPIYLQGDHGPVAYRNLILRPVTN